MVQTSSYTFAISFSVAGSPLFLCVKLFLVKDMGSGTYVDEWKLVVPENIQNSKNGAW